ncbi:MAG: hypothetical protein MK082_09565 [Phycisphaerales bacterium]|nr:hypothetical protein [Phycisphaerales bacterium]
MPRTIAQITLFGSLLLVLAGGCGPLQAYEGPSLPSYETARLDINPPQADIGFQLTAVNDRPINAQVAVSIKSGSNKLALEVWPTTSTTFSESDPAFAEHYQMIDQKFGRMMTITFDARAGVTYGLNGTFTQGATPSESSYSIQVFEQDSKNVVARASSDGIPGAADEKVDALRDTEGQDWSVEAGPGS